MKNFEWKKKGQLLNLTNYSDWGITHGQVPYYFEIDGKKKVYFTSRPPKSNDGSYVSYIYSLELEESLEGFKIRDVNKNPILKLGNWGCFDEFGIMPCSVIKHPEKNEVWMYYVGWSRKVSVPYDGAIGIAISKDGGETFEKLFNGPIIGPNKYDPFLIGCPRVYLFNKKWYMFYLSGISWFDSNGSKECYYKLKLATSENGIEWDLNDKFIIPENYENECQTCASVFYLNGKYNMYFTYRHAIDFRNPERGYRIGFAYSEDLVTWTRNDELGNFSTSNHGWDSEMVCYPNVNLIHDKLTMFYCGNQFGFDGFGYAEL
jgi:predicted GH43/DUF377 family glycosyl hydrolase